MTCTSVGAGDVRTSPRDSEARSVPRLSLEQVAQGESPPPSGRTSPRSARSTKGNKIPQAAALESAISDSLLVAMRATMRSELGELLSEKGPLRGVLRQEFVGAMQEQRLNRLGSNVPNDSPTRPSMSPRRSRDLADFKDELEAMPMDDVKEVEWEQFREQKAREQEDTQDSGNIFSQAISNLALQSIVHDRRDDTGNFQKKLDALVLWCQSLEEPERTGILALIARSRHFETLVCFVILANCLFMGVVANFEVANPGKSGEWILIGDWVFQVIYTAELALKLVVHRHYFFVNDHWKLNGFDVFLVGTGLISLVGEGLFSGDYLRLIRLFKFGKAIRALKVMTALKELRAFVVCIMGSFSSFFWSLVTLSLVFFVFSLMFVQLVAGYVADNGDNETLMSMYGNVSQSMLTLFRASTGGDDWAVQFDAIAQTGPMGGVLFILFIAFTQLALINIITGIFVESAMSTLTPDRETQALENERREKANAYELEHLCKLVDSDYSGKLTPDQFEDGINKGRIPTLLTLLGLQKHHVKQFFYTMSKKNKDDEGQVDIKDFVAGCMFLKGAATNFDLQQFHAEFVATKMKTQDALSEQSRRLVDISRTLHQMSNVVHGNVLGY